MGNLIEQLVSDLRHRPFGIGIDDGVEGEDIGVWGFFEGLAGVGELAAFGVEEDEVVGEVGGAGDEGLDEKSVEGFAG